MSKEWVKTWKGKKNKNKSIFNQMEKYYEVLEARLKDGV